MKRITILLIILAGFFVFEPIYRDKTTLAITYFGDPGSSYEQAFNGSPDELIEQKAEIPHERARAPEPSTFFMLLTGLGGVLLRFAHKSFERFKRLLDMVLSVFGLLVTLPIVLYSALLIKLTSKGPVIYKQLRLGKNGEIFSIYKLRTMNHDAEKKTGAVWAQANDPRITAVGKVLRKTRIDEIPQFFNVIRGEMSIVGPRPERPEMVRTLKTLILDYEKRLQVKPGITGLAQVLHKYDESIEDVKKKICYDLEYIHNRCLSTELQILGKTVIAVVTGKGAR